MKGATAPFICSSKFFQKSWMFKQFPRIIWMWPVYLLEVEYWRRLPQNA